MYYYIKITRMALYIFLQSFVRKVTSRVTNLLPQPSWLSKWFTSSVDSEAHRRDTLNSNDSDSEDDDSDTINVHTPPVKRAKIPLNQRFPPNSFKVSSVINDQGMLEVLKCNLKCYSNYTHLSVCYCHFVLFIITYVAE